MKRVQKNRKRPRPTRPANPPLTVVVPSTPRTLTELLNQERKG